MTTATPDDESPRTSIAVASAGDASPTVDSSGMSAAKSRAYRVPLRWRDLDSQGHVYHAEYVTLADEGRTLWLGDVLAVPDPENYVVVHIAIDYVAELRRPVSEVEFTAGVEHVGNTSIRTRETLRVAGDAAGGTIVARISCVFLLWDPEAQQARHLTDDERVALTRPERDDPSRGSHTPAVGNGVRP